MKRKDRMVSKACASFGKTDIGSGSSVHSSCEYKNVCRIRGYCVVWKSMRIDEMNRRFSKRIRRPKTRNEE